jgi:hypothetical protein
LATDLATQLLGTGWLTEGNDQAKNPAGSSLNNTAWDYSGRKQRFTKPLLAQRCDGLSLLLCHVRPPPPALGSDRDQLWAEAAAAEVSGEPLTIPEDLWGDAAVEQKARMNQDAWEDLLSTRLASLHNNKKEMDGKFALAVDDSGNPEWRVSTSFLLNDVIGIPKERQGDAVTKRLASVMRSIGWTRPSTAIRIGKAGPCRGFVLVEPLKAGNPEDKKGTVLPLQGEVLAPSTTITVRVPIAGAADVVKLRRPLRIL